MGERRSECSVILELNQYTYLTSQKISAIYVACSTIFHLDTYRYTCMVLPKPTLIFKYNDNQLYHSRLYFQHLLFVRKCYSNIKMRGRVNYEVTYIVRDCSDEAGWSGSGKLFTLTGGASVVNV